MSKKTKRGRRLLKLCRSLTKQLSKVEEIFGGDDFLDVEMNELWTLIREEYGVSLDWEEVGGDEAVNAIGLYCDGGITLKEAENILEQVHSRQHNTPPKSKK